MYLKRKKIPSIFIFICVIAGFAIFSPFLQASDGEIQRFLQAAKQVSKDAQMSND